MGLSFVEGTGGLKGKPEEIKHHFGSTMLVVLLVFRRNPPKRGTSGKKRQHPPKKNPPLGGGGAKKTSAPRALGARPGFRAAPGSPGALGPASAGPFPAHVPPELRDGRPKRGWAEAEGSAGEGSAVSGEPRWRTGGRGQKVWWAKKGRSPKSPRAQKKATCLQLQDLSVKVQTSLPEPTSWRCKVNDGGLQMVPLLPRKGKGSQD